jgi:membrane fusion protein (multidrug efflux system)
MIIPQKATFEVLDKKYVFVVDENNVIKSRELTIDKELPHIYLIKAGLAKSDKILIDGLRNAKSGDKISYDFEAPIKVMSHLDLYAE